MLLKLQKVKFVWLYAWYAISSQYITTHTVPFHKFVLYMLVAQPLRLWKKFETSAGLRFDKITDSLKVGTF